MKTPSRSFEIVILERGAIPLHKVRVIVGVDYKRVDSAEKNDLLDLMNTFSKVFVLDKDLSTPIEKVLDERREKTGVRVLQRSTMAIMAEYASAFPTIASACAFGAFCMSTYLEPSLQSFGFTIVTIVGTSHFYNNWQRRVMTMSLRARFSSMILAEDRNPTILFVTGKAFATLMEENLKEMYSFRLSDVSKLQKKATIRKDTVESESSAKSNEGTAELDASSDENEKARIDEVSAEGTVSAEAEEALAKEQENSMKQKEEEDKQRKIKEEALEREEKQMKLEKEWRKIEGKRRWKSW